ncbi:MAG TPA: 4-alpha-glucanotransferase [Candidatus Saccharimonadales bacterium]|nr:4-alpha-glucanotransferase [Candidatus Saccharimonadales bacterium]
MKFQRSSGVLLHPTSLPGPYGAGDLGPQAFSFIEFLAEAGQKIWQVLPLNPTGYADSPYQCFSAFAGNPLLISLDLLADQGLLSRADLAAVPAFPTSYVDYGAVIEFRFAMLRRAAERFFTTLELAPNNSRRAEYKDFCLRQASWLEDYALFMAAKDAHGGVSWTSWEHGLVVRKPEALASWRERLATEIAAYKFWQFEFFRQWSSLREACNARGIRIMGDVPIYVAHDSADVWTARQLFWLDEDGNPLKVSGVPPDYFSATGQLWGNPTYRWDLLREDGFRWWIARVRGVMEMFDLVRIDHFRGFEAYFEIPAGETTAVNGSWIKGPGMELFEALEREFGDLPIVAENLGNITPEVEAIRTRFDYPGMAILQFAFGTDPQGPSFRPHNYVRNLVAYTGGHDNDTTLGWWNSGIADSTRSEDDLRREHAFASAYLNVGEGEEIQWAMIRALMASVADTVLVPMQDILGLGSEARMNLPGRMSGNWKWRYELEQLQPEMGQRLRALAELYDR